MKHLRFKTKEAWLKWRRGGIGASDSLVIAAAVPESWGTQKTLWETKIGIETEKRSTPAMRRGLDLESAALQEYCYQKKEEFRVGFFQSEKNTFQLASLDGVSKDFKRAVEIKCPGHADHTEALSGKVPEHYTWQLTHILMVLDLPEMDYFSFDGQKGVIVSYKRDLGKEAWLLKEEHAFWNCVLNKIEPVSKKFPKLTKEMGFQERLAIVRGGKK